MSTQEAAKAYNFPKDFVWGTATAAHQVEGNNKNSDWWHWEQSKKHDDEYPKDVSGEACDSYNRYEEDFDLCTQLNNDAVRISVEWARIEPNEGEFSQVALDHYKKVLTAAKDRNLKTFVTLHHFTNPLWLSKKGGWTNIKTPKLFAKYAKRCAQELGDLVDSFITINEPQIYTFQSYVTGKWPPNKKNYFTALVVQITMMFAHKLAYKAIKSVREIPIGIAKNIVWYERDLGRSTWYDGLVIDLLNFIGRDFFVLPVKRQLDFLGINYYSTNRIVKLKIDNPCDYESEMGWWIHADGLKNILLHARHIKIPVYITENGLADATDTQRIQFIEEHLISCWEALQENANLKGYFHWSLMDNFEWGEGFWPRFGLVEIDRENNLARIPRKSFYYYADICKRNRLDV